MTIPSFKTIKRWKLIEDWRHRASVDAVITSMVDKGYSSETMVRAVRFIGAFVECQNNRDSGEPERLDAADIDGFIASRLAAGAIENGNRIALRRLQTELARAGALSPPEDKADPSEKVATLFGAELHRRGYSKHSISGHLWSARRFLRTVWTEHGGVSQLTHIEVRNYLANNFEGRKSNSLGTWFSRLRVLLRFLHASALTEHDLSAAAPSPRNLRFSALPAYMSVSQLKSVLEAGDLSTIPGRRDLAVLLLLSRLGLRASEVALLSLDDIDWRSGLLRVNGKGGRVATMPLPKDVGAAISDYILHGRPTSGSRTIFHRVQTPCTPFETATPVILIARRALKRAKISGTRSHHAHIFRHTFATIAVRSGVGMTELAQLLRHKDPDTTRIYAKFDIEGLRSLSRPWAGVVL
ncbi:MULTISPECIES: tyrosine-type recombinase/integrase [Rhizobium]|uniref:tyrosine-type recombinase/integrase n=1 Tax=Rhizobium TaxID=379 RepID=UPI001C82CFB5|nr:MULTISPECIES: tyrosine-type recombinase/integrase [Rhizobium]MBX4905115.1 tyrosine-type recombinase/integrase [Rhizobium bangladeshense]MBX4927159.1 tyrosine-type recombinase/integrase [Rhizobium binae]